MNSCTFCTLSLSPNQWKYVFTQLSSAICLFTALHYGYTHCALNISAGVCVCVCVWSVYLDRLCSQTINVNDIKCVMWLWKPHCFRWAFYIHTVSYIACQDDDESRRHSKQHSNLKVHWDNYKPHHMHHSFSSKWAMRKRKDTGRRPARLWKMHIWRNGNLSNHKHDFELNKTLIDQKYNKNSNIVITV